MEDIRSTHHAPGRHILLDFWQCQGLSKQGFIEDTLKQAATACEATILKSQFHSFGDEGGITGVLILAESHISIHTWPELSYAALDIFMCGDCDPEAAIPVLRDAFQPGREQIHRIERGSSDE